MRSPNVQVSSYDRAGVLHGGSLTACHLGRPLCVDVMAMEYDAAGIEPVLVMCQYLVPGNSAPTADFACISQRFYKTAVLVPVLVCSINARYHQTLHFLVIDLDTDHPVAS
jgi:hypothetical protein